MGGRSVTCHTRLDSSNGYFVSWANPLSAAAAKRSIGSLDGSDSCLRLNADLNENREIVVKILSKNLPLLELKCSPILNKRVSFWLLKLGLAVHHVKTCMCYPKYVKIKMICVFYKS